MSKHSFDPKSPSLGCKKQKLDKNNYCNGDGETDLTPSNGFSHPIVRREMCLFCFDVLHKYLNNQEPPPAPRTFSNNA